MPRKSPVANRVQEAGIFQATETPPAPTPSTAKPARTKRTFYLEEDAIVTLRHLQVARLQQTGKEPELSHLVTEAIRRLGELELTTS